MASQGDLQLRRFWPESGREELLPAFLDRRNDDLPVTVFPGGKEIAFFGIFSTSPDHAGTAGLYALGLDSKRARPLGGGAWTGFSRAMSATPDGKSLITRMIQSQQAAQDFFAGGGADSGCLCLCPKGLRLRSLFRTLFPSFSLFLFFPFLFLRPFLK